MTAAAFADLVQARPLGSGRWEARCPAHPDRSPSLAIREGAEGRVLVRCWAGCALAAVLASLHLGMRDLFHDAPVDPAAREQARRERVKREAAERQRAKLERRAGDMHRRLALVTDALGARLARAPDGPEADALALLFHRSCRMRAEVESSLGTGSAVKTPCLPSRLSPFNPSEEQEEADRVATEAQLLCYLGTGRTHAPSVLTPNNRTTESPVVSGALRRTA